MGVIFACVLLGAYSLCLAQQANTPGGNRALMEEWKSKQNIVKQEIYEKLKQEGQLPKSGIIEFEARVKADPRDKDKVQIQINDVRVIDQDQRGPGRQVRVRANPAGNEPYVSKQSMRVPGVEYRDIEMKGGVVIQDRVEFRNIDMPGGGLSSREPVQNIPAPESAPLAVQPPAAPEPEQKSWWKKLFGMP